MKIDLAGKVALVTASTAGSGVAHPQGPGARRGQSPKRAATSTRAEGLTTERLGNGTLIKVPDTWPAQQVVDALTETFQTNNLDEVPITW